MWYYAKTNLSIHLTHDVEVGFERDHLVQFNGLVGMLSTCNCSVNTGDRQTLRTATYILMLEFAQMAGHTTTIFKRHKYANLMPIHTGTYTHKPPPISIC